MDCLDIKFVKVKKRRQCFGCLRWFDPNTKMRREVYADNGNIYSIYTCKVCVDYLELISEKFVPGDYLDEGWFWEGLNYNYKSEKSPEEILAELRYEKSVR